MRAMGKKSILLALSSLLLFVLLFSGISISLDSFDGRFESLLGHILDRKVTIHGPVQLTLSLQPVLELGGVTIANPPGWPEENVFLTVNHGRAQLDLFPLIKGDIHIKDLEFDGVDLRLVTRTNHTNNFNFGTSSPEPDKEKTVHELTGLDAVKLRDIRLSYLDEMSGKEYSLTIDEAHGQGMPGSSLRFFLRGKLSGQDCVLDISAGSLHDLLYGKQPWPLSKGTLEIAGTVLDISGSLVRTEEELTEYLEVALQGPNLDAIGSLFETKLPATGKISIAGRLSLLPGAFHFLNLRLDVLESSLQGDLVLSLQGTRPTLEGSIVAPFIKQAIFSVFDGGVPENSIAEVQAEKQNATLPWDMLQLLDTDLHVQIDKINHDRFTARDIKMVVALVDGDLVLPFSFVAMDVAAGGQVDIMSSGPTPFIEVTANTESVKLAPFLESLAVPGKFGGEFGALALVATSRGESLEKLKEQLDVDVKIGSTSFHAESGVAISSNEISLQRRAGKEFTLSGKGDALGSPFTFVALAAGADTAEISNALSLNLTLHACDTELLLEAMLREDYTSDFHFSVTGKKLCGYLAPLSQIMGKEIGFSTKGRGKISQDNWSVNLEAIQLDNFLFDAVVEQQKTAPGKPFFTASVHSHELDISAYVPEPAMNDAAQGDKQDEPVQTNPEVETAAKATAPKESTAAVNKKLSRLLPQKSLLSVDAKIELHIDRLETGRGAASDILLSVLFKDGKLTGAPFHATVAEQSFGGDVQIDLTDEDPVVQFDLTAESFDLPALYKEFGLGKAQELQADNIHLNVLLKGRTVEDLMKKSSQKLTIKRGTYRIEKEFGENLVIDIQETTAFNVPGKKTNLLMSGHINAEPFSVNVEEIGLLQEDTLKPVIGTAMLSIGDTKFVFDGKIDRKTKDESIIDCVYSLSGTRMDNLNWLIGVNLPPLGPYAAEGSFYAEDGTLSFYDLVLQVGESTLLGQMIITGTKTEGNTFDYPVNWDVVLQAKSIQLNDFQFGDWSPVAEEEEAEADQVTPEEDKQSEGTMHNLLSPELAAKFRGSMKLQVDEVLSGTDKLGSGLLSATLKDGLYSLDTLKLNIPGGDVVMQGSFRPETNWNRAQLSMQIENLDYGILVRRTTPESDLKGKLNVNFALHSEAQALSQLKEHMGGTFRFGVLPEEYEAGTVDLWAVNIVTAVLPALLKGTPSKANCLAGKFLLDDGIMRPEVFLLDTSKMRVQGEGEVNFKTNAIDFYLSPTPKAAHFFSLATPVTVSGTITDYRIGVTAGAVLGTAAQLVTSVVTVPFEWLFTENLEADGKAACTEAMDWINPGPDGL